VTDAPARPRARGVPARRALVALASAVAVAVAVAPAVPSSAASQEAPCDGVLVVVDHGERAPVTGCAEGDPANGFEALAGAGFEVDVLVREPRFLCRIDGRPADDPCLAFAPADAYWSAWTRGPDGWDYAVVGAADLDPAPGAVLGWAFGAGTPPRLLPAATATSTVEPGADPDAPRRRSPALTVVAMAAALAGVLAARARWARPMPGASAGPDRPDRPASDTAVRR